MPPTSAARCRTRSGLADSYSFRTAVASVRSTSLRRGTINFFTPRACRRSQTNEPRNPAPPVTTTVLSFQKSLMVSDDLYFRRIEVELWKLQIELRQCFYQCVSHDIIAIPFFV